ncbi:putative DNA-binding domain-containing protein [Thermomonas sp. HDW16]|uniref:HvfC/BufC N-terminal domain-containing protein n=1 Tax=Thermomonas sp. HDW16 TaxID=2714945 RepID=UPI00140920BA|nr:putative DNA-binding domain-containing protein [Thermomonas sp. HDW16]QIL19293.1 DUF2063 domain-containing protein [Thermomonas sp. HDW16]
MNALITTQDAMQRWLLQGDAAIGMRVDGQDVAQRLRIYADAYRLRLLEVLGNDFPVTKAVLGDDAFDALCVDYLHAHPSTQPSARHFGHAFPDWLHARCELPHTLHQLARFEWLQGEVFDGADAPLLGIEQIVFLPAEDWPGLRLRLHPTARLLALSCNAAELVETHAQELVLPELLDAAPSHWLLWRADGDVHWRQLDARETDALHAVASGEPFARLCERLQTEDDDGALRAASLLKRWLADGLLAAA